METKTQKALQTEFDEILTCIKPLYLSWNNNQERIIVANWIKKLTNTKCSTINSLHLRNLYTLALYENLRNQSLNDTFLINPPNSDLPPLPSNLKQMIEKFSVKMIPNPSWLEIDTSSQKVEPNMLLDHSQDYEEDDYIGELRYSEEALANNVNYNSADPGPTLLTLSGLGGYSQNNTASPSDTAFSTRFPQTWFERGIITTKVPVSAQLTTNKDQNPLERPKAADHEVYIMTMEGGAKKDSYEPFHGNECEVKSKNNDQCLLNKVQEKEILLSNISSMEKRLAQLQNSYHEDILQLRSQHELDMQNLIARKNQEIEECRTEHREKMRLQEAQMQQLEQKASDCLKQLQIIQDNKNKEISALKKTHQESSDTQSQHYDKKLAHLYDDFQKEKQTIVNESRKREDTLTKETQDYFNKLKIEFSEKTSNTNSDLMQLEKDVADLREFKGNLEEKNGSLELEKYNLSFEIKKLQTVINEANKKYQILENQNNRLVSTLNTEVQSLKDSLELAEMKNKDSKDEGDARFNQTVDKMESQIYDLQLKVKEERRHHEVELENTKFSANAEKNRIKQSLENEVENLKSQLKTTKIQLETKCQELEKQLNLKDMQLAQSLKETEVKEKMANQMVEDLRQEMTHSSERQLRKKKFDFEQIEAELRQEIQEKTKEISDLMMQLSQQKQESEAHLCEARCWSDGQIASISQHWQTERANIEKECQDRISTVIADHARELVELKNQLTQTKTKMEGELETTRNQLEEEVHYRQQMDETHRQELAKLTLEYDSRQRQCEFATKTEREDMTKTMTELKTSLEKKHAEHVNQILYKTNDKLKEIEDEYGSRSYQSFQMISELKSNIEALKEEKSQTTIARENHISIVTKKNYTEIENLQKVNKLNLEAHNKKVSSLQSQLRQAEKHLERRRGDHERQLGQQRQEYESRLSSLLPVQVQTDYEETIQSLRQQIGLLQQRIGILEGEVVNICGLGGSSNGDLLSPVLSAAIFSGSVSVPPVHKSSTISGFSMKKFDQIKYEE